jgi:hypothetical protein
MQKKCPLKSLEILEDRLALLVDQIVLKPELEPASLANPAATAMPRLSSPMGALQRRHGTYLQVAADLANGRSAAPPWPESASELADGCSAAVHCLPSAVMPGSPSRALIRLGRPPQPPCGLP